MPNYNPAITRVLYDGAKATMADATLVTPFTSQAFCVGPDPSGNPPSVTIQNKSSAAAPVEISTDDVDADYDAFNSVPANSVAVLPIPDGVFFRLALAAAPSGAIVVTR